MRSLVTGSHGFIGSQLVKALAERGDEVFCYDSKRGNHVTFGLEFPRVDEIYHLACVNQEVSEVHPEESYYTNRLLPKWIASEALRMSARLVYTSTASVYGYADEIPTPISAEINPLTTYARDKAVGEDWIRNKGIDWTIFRLSNVYGPGQSVENPYCGVVAKFLDSARKGEPLKIIGDGSQTRDFTFVGDVIPHLMNPELKGIHNVSHGKEISIIRLARLVDWYAGKDIPPPYLVFTDPRPVDGIDRRCLIPTVECSTDIGQGLELTLDYLNETEKASPSFAVEA